MSKGALRAATCSLDIDLAYLYKNKQIILIKLARILFHYDEDFEADLSEDKIDNILGARRSTERAYVFVIFGGSLP